MKKTFLIMALLAMSVSATEIPWRVSAYTFTARSMSVGEALETFAVAEGVPMILSQGVRGAISGSFKNVPAKDFLDRVCTVNNLTWYYDGASIWVYGAGETLTTLLDLRYMKAEEVLRLMRELGMEDKRFPLKTAAHGEMVMVSGPPRYVTLVVDMINKADHLREMRTFTEVETKLFPLKYTWADNVSYSQTSSSLESSTTIKGVAYLLQEIMQQTADNVQEGTNRLEGVASGRPQPVIRPENRLNAVLIRDAATRMPMYADLIRQLDVPQKLVEIGVTTLELSRDDALDWQASLSLGGDFTRGGSHTAGIGYNADNLTDIASESLSGLGAAGAYSYIGRHVNISASISALKSKGKARNIARTSILTLNNMCAEISDTSSYSTKLVGEKVASVSETSAGTKLAVKPRVVEPPEGTTNVARQVWLTIELQDGGLDMLNTVDSLPTKHTTTVETQASLPEGESLLLAGNFTDVDEDTSWGIPLLRDIPFIGWLFGGYSQAKSTVQRMFILTPHVISPFFESTPTSSVTTAQILRGRDTSAEEAIADTVDRDDLARKEREADLEEKHDIRHEIFDETFERNTKERDLRREQRKDTRKDSHAEWEGDYRKRLEAYEKFRKEIQAEREREKEEEKAGKDK